MAAGDRSTPTTENPSAASIARSAPLPQPSSAITPPPACWRSRGKPWPQPLVVRRPPAPAAKKRGQAPYGEFEGIRPLARKHRVIFSYRESPQASLPFHVDTIFNLDASRYTRTFLSQPIAGTETDDPASTLPPVHRASTIFLPTLSHLKSADWRNRSQPPYGRDGSRAACELETRLAHIEGARQALVVSSGLAAYALICMALLSPGDVVAMPTNGYGTAQQMLRNVFHRFGIGIVLYDPMAPDTWAEAVPPFHPPVVRGGTGLGHHGGSGSSAPRRAGR